MKILLVNDDGWRAEGLWHLTEAATRLGKVWIVAPDGQCSAMSHRLTIRTPMRLRQEEYSIPVEGVWSLTGMPADCTKIGLFHVMQEKPDWVISGINHGMNLGFDTFYSGTISAAIEGQLNEVPAIALSNETGEHWELVDRYLGEILERLITLPLKREEIWNVNFPDCSVEECAGIRWDVKPYFGHIFSQEIAVVGEEGKDVFVSEDGPLLSREDAPEDTDTWALQHKYIAVGKIRWSR